LTDQSTAQKKTNREDPSPGEGEGGTGIGGENMGTKKRNGEEAGKRKPIGKSPRHHNPIRGGKKGRKGVSRGQDCPKSTGGSLVMRHGKRVSPSAKRGGWLPRG